MIRVFALGLAALLVSCGRGGFDEPAGALALDGLTVTISEPAAGEVVPHEITLRGICSAAQRLDLAFGGDVAPVTTAGCSDTTFSAVLTFLPGSGSKNVTVSLPTSAGYALADERAFRRTGDGPVLTITGAVDGLAEVYSASDSTTVEGTCEVGLAIVVSGATADTLACIGGLWSYDVPTTANDGERIFTFAQTDSDEETTVVTLRSVRDTEPPIIDSVLVNGGATQASGNVLPLVITAHDVGGAGLGDYRVGLSDDLSSSDWLTIAPQTVTFPLTSGSYAVRAQVRDRAGNATAVKSATAVTLAIGNPPLVNVIAPRATLTASASSPVLVAWSVATPSGNALASTPIDVHATTNDGNSTRVLVSGLNATNNGASIPDGATGSAMIEIPADLNGKVFRLVVFARDAIGAIGAASTVPLNGSHALTVVGGRNAKAVGQSALATAFTATGSIARDPSTGDVYLSLVNGTVIYKVASSTGRMTLWAGTPHAVGPAGAGGPPAGLQFELVGARAYEGGAIAIDSASNVYLVSTSGIWKCTQTRCDAFIGKRSGTGITSGTRAADFNFSEVHHGWMDLGTNDRVYLYISPNACYDSTNYYPCALAYRLEDDGTLTLLAGSSAQADPEPSNTSHDALHVRVRGFTVATDAGGDHLFAGGATLGEGTRFYYALRDDGLLYKTSVRGTYLYRYDRARQRIPYATSSATVGFIDPATGNALAGTMPLTSPGATIAPRDLAFDEYGGAYAIPVASNFVFYWANGASTYNGFAGAPLVSNDGSDALLADLRGIRSLTFDDDGTLLAHAQSSGRVITIDSSGVTGSLSIGGMTFNSGGGTPLFTRYVSLGSPIVDKTGACVFFCGSSATSESTYAPYATSGAAAGLALTLSGYTSSRSAIARDGAITYVHIPANDGSHSNAFVKRIDASGNMTNVAGSPSLDDITTPLTADPTTTALNASVLAGTRQLTEHHAGVFDSTSGSTLYAYGTRLYMLLSDNHVVTAQLGGAWVSHGFANALWVDRTTGDGYYVSGSSAEVHRFVAAANDASFSDTTLFTLGPMVGTDLRGLIFAPGGNTTLYFATDTQILTVSTP